MLDRYYFFEWRQARGISQREMARRMDIHYSVLSRIEAGKRDWNGQFLAKFAETIGCHISDPLRAKPGKASVDRWIDDHVQDEVLREDLRHRTQNIAEQLRDALFHGRTIANWETLDPDI